MSSSAQVMTDDTHVTIVPEPKINPPLVISVPQTKSTITTTLVTNVYIINIAIVKILCISPKEGKV